MGSGRYFAPGPLVSVDSEFGNTFAYSFDYLGEGMDALYRYVRRGGGGPLGLGFRF